MTLPFDIFQSETSGSVRWLEAVATLEEAKARVQELAVRSPCEFLIFSQKTGMKLSIKVDGVRLGKAADRKPVRERHTP